MKYFSEFKAENFLEKNGFPIAKRKLIKTKLDLLKGIKEVGTPFVMKVSGKKIIHKNKLNGVRIKLKTLIEAEKNFFELMKIKNAEGVLFHEFIPGELFFLGIKKTNEFGHVLIFGKGGIDVEKNKNLSYRIFPLSYEDFEKMFLELKLKIPPKMKDFIFKIIVLLEKLVKKYNSISELDINPLVINSNEAVVVDARIVFE